MTMSLRVALIGSEGLRSHDRDKQLTCYGWGDLAAIKNLSDFDIVILNLLSLSEAKKVDWTAFSRALPLATAAEIIGHGGRILIVGDPRIEVTLPSESGKGTYKEPFLEWCGMEFEWDNRSGQSKQCNYQDYHDLQAYNRYLEHLDTWSYSLRVATPKAHDLARVLAVDANLSDRNGLRLAVHNEPFCASRYDTALAGALSPCLVQRNGLDHLGRPIWDEIKRFGSIVFLPPNRLSAADSIGLLLEDVCDIRVHRSEPAWIEAMEAPGQAAVDDDLRAIEAEIRSQVERLEAKRADRISTRRLLGLLYEQHGALEDVVREALTELGAEVENPVDPTKEDGWLTVRVGDQVFDAVLEIKGTGRDQFDESGLRQLDEWVSRGIDQRDKRPKGIFVGNPATALPPADRPDPFGVNFRRSAHLRGFVVVRSEDLYDALCLKKRGGLDTDRFWLDLLSTDGVFEFHTLTLTSSQATDCSTIHLGI